jgi:hypothetical protein
MSRYKDIQGQRFGRLVVLSLSHIHKVKAGSYAVWNVSCDCGNRTKIEGRLLRSGNNVSCGCAKGKQYGISARNQVLGSYKSRAKKQNRLFLLSDDEVRYIMSLPCHYCKTEPKQIKSNKNSKGTYTYNGIDRINSDGNYEISNVLPCCGICNRAKHRMSYDDFMQWIERLRANR